MTAHEVNDEQNREGNSQQPEQRVANFSAFIDGIFDRFHAHVSSFRCRLDVSRQLPLSIFSPVFLDVELPPARDSLDVKTNHQRSS